MSDRMQDSYPLHSWVRAWLVDDHVTIAEVASAVWHGPGDRLVFQPQGEPERVGKIRGAPACVGDLVCDDVALA